MDNMAIKSYEQAEALIKPKYRAEFKEFIKTGDLSQELDDYITNNKQAEEALEWCFKESCREMDEMMEKFRKAFDVLPLNEKQAYLKKMGIDESSLPKENRLGKILKSIFKR